MRINEKIAGINGSLASGSTATLKLPVNRRYHWLKFFLVANTTAAGHAALTNVKDIIESIQLYVGGRLVRDVTPLFLQMLCKLNGVTGISALELPIFFSEPWRASVMDEQATAWDVNDVTDFSVRIKFLATAQDIGLTGLACYDGGRARLANGQVVLNIVKHLPYSAYAVAGSRDFTEFPVNLPIQRIYFTGVDANQITKVDVIADSFKIHEAEEAENAAILSDYKLDASAFDYPLLFDPHQQLFDTLMVQRDLTVRVFTASAGQIGAILETRAGAYI